MNDDMNKPFPAAMAGPDYPWTLYDMNAGRIWGGAFKTREKADRWRFKAGLPYWIIPRDVRDM